MKTFPVGLARNNAESDRCAILAIDHDVGERRNTNDIDANRRKEMISKKPLDNGSRMIVELSLVNSIEASVDLSKFVVHLNCFYSVCL